MTKSSLDGEDKEAEKHPITEQELIENVSILPGKLDLQHPTHRMVIDDMATYGDKSLIEYLISPSAAESVSIIELALVRNIFTDERDSRHGLVGDETMHE